MLAQFVYEMGSWEVDTDRRELRAHGRVVPLGSRAFQIVEKLVRSAGQFVTKDELVAYVWSGAVVEENTLRVHVHAIRKALGPDRTLLKTDAGRGYRLIGRWTEHSAPADPSAQTAQSPSARSEMGRNILPALTSDIVGRKQAVDQLKDLITAFRVVTLAGPGGIGKTTLALELARAVSAEFDHGICLVEFASLADPALVPSTVAAALGRQTDTGVATAEHVARLVGSARLMLVLDNCEHVVDAAANLIEVVVRGCPNVSLVVTSREVMRVDGERVFRVQSLDAPESSQVHQRLIEFSAVELFVRRIKALDDGFSPTPAVLSDVASICRRLDGIPLAIEFAAARAATLGVPQVALGLSNRFNLLTSGLRAALPRHRTLRATLDWSYELLSSAEAALLRKLAIFAGAFTLSDVQAIARSPHTIEWLSELVGKSLVIAEAKGSTTLYRLLETTRAYAFEKLETAGELGNVARQHAIHYQHFFERIESEWEVRPTGDLSLEYGWRREDLRAALSWSFSELGDAEIGVALATAAIPFWKHLSSLNECRQFIEQALERSQHVGTGAVERLMKMHAAVGSSSVGRPVEATAAWQRTLQLARQVGDVDYQLQALRGLWLAGSGDSLDIARQFTLLATTTADRTVGERMTAISFHWLGRQAEARQHIDRVVSAIPALNASSGIVRFQVNQGPAAHAFKARILWMQGHLKQAIDAASRAVEEAVAVNHGFSTCHALTYAACPIWLWAGDFDRCRQYVQMATDYSNKHALLVFAVWIRCYRGMLEMQSGDAANGIELLRSGLETLAAGRSSFRVLDLRGALALAIGRAGRARDGHAAIGEAIATAVRTNEQWSLPELLRVEGELVRLLNGEGLAGDPDACFRGALEEARRQGALFWELRAAVSLAESLRHQGRPLDGAAALRPVYARFTEGLDLPVLRSASSLLDTLAEA